MLWGLEFRVTLVLQRFDPYSGVGLGALFKRTIVERYKDYVATWHLGPPIRVNHELLLIGV